MKMAYDDKLERVRCDDCGRFVSFDSATIEHERTYYSFDGSPEDLVHAKCKMCEGSEK
jgi:hypothetical protein